MVVRMLVPMHAPMTVRVLVLLAAPAVPLVSGHHACVSGGARDRACVSA